MIWKFKLSLVGQMLGLGEGGVNTAVEEVDESWSPCEYEYVVGFSLRCLVRLGDGVVLCWRRLVKVVVGD